MLKKYHGSPTSSAIYERSASATELNAKTGTTSRRAGGKIVGSMYSSQS